MDPSQDNKIKIKHWWSRLIRANNNMNGASPKSEAYDNATDRSRRSFRKSLRTFQTTVKNCMFPQYQKISPRTFQDIPSSSIGVLETVEPPTVPPRPPMLRLEECAEQANGRVPKDEILSLSMCYWYWGPMARQAAEEVLKFKPDGTFLVRDSSSTSYLFSISFRSIGKTMHARIEYNKGKYSMFGTSLDGFNTVLELVADAMKMSETGICGYSRRRDFDCDLPVRLTKPISRYTQVRSLKFLSRFVIRQCTNINDIPKLPLPTVLYDYLLEESYF